MAGRPGPAFLAHGFLSREIFTHIVEGYGAREVLRRRAHPS